MCLPTEKSVFALWHLWVGSFLEILKQKTKTATPINSVPLCRIVKLPLVSYGPQEAIGALKWCFVYLKAICKAFFAPVLSNSAVDVAIVVRNAEQTRISWIKTVLFRESNFFAENELVLFLDSRSGLEVGWCLKTRKTILPSCDNRWNWFDVRCCFKSATGNFS